MRELIALAATGLGSALVLAVIRAMSSRRPGRHTAEFLAELPEPKPQPTTVDPWAKPWPTQTPEHVRALYAPLRGEDVALTRPYCRMEDTMDLGVIRERRTAAVLATLGVDYAYGYAGDHFETLAALTTAGVTA
ncbi:hypothetical protein ACF1CG_17760 [Streptomyces sp. NPDC014773]|uniref:hypothetical protein n=1 Tax=Streptomyces sp. NPDC014773 TaxID=3364908 RepID=UPI0036FB475E